MKKLLLLIILFISLKSFSQTPSNFVYRNIYEHTKGSYPDSVLHLPVGCGAPSLLTTRSWKGGAALYGDTCNNKLYFYRDTAWTLIGDSAYNDIRYLANTIRCGLTCSACGIVTYTGTGMHYYVSPAYYNIDFVPYYFAGDSVTLADGDATFDRFDAIVLTASGVDTIQGIPTSDPQLPQFDPCANILLTYVLVTAGTTTPAQVSDEVIYDENVETWTHTTGGTITANFAGTAQVFHGTKSITISSWSNNSYINFLGPSSYINSNYSTLSFWVRLTAIMVNNQNVSVQFFNNTTAVSNQVVGQITKGNITTYQSVAFNMSQFTFTSPVFNTVRIQFSGSQSNTFYLDWVRLQAGIVQPPAPTGLNNAYTRVTDGTTTATAIGGDIIKLRANAPLHTTVTNNDATHGDNALFFADTLRSTANSLATNGIVKKQIDSLAALSGVSQSVITDTLKNYWRLTGNNAIAGTLAGSFIGSTNNISMRFRTNNTEKMVLDSNGRVGIGTNAPDATSLLDLTSTTNGFLTPRMNYAQRNAISSPANGLLIYNTQTNRFNWYNSTAWKVINDSASFVNIYNSDGTLTGIRSVSLGSNSLNFSGTGSDNVIIHTSGSSGAALQISSSDPTSVAFLGLITNAPTNSITEVCQLQIQTGTAATGIGISVPLYVENSTGGAVKAAETIAKWKNVTNANRTSQYIATAVTNANMDTVMALGDYVTLTESSATKFTSTIITTSKIQGGQIIVTVEANDGTDFQSRTLRFIWTAVNKAGTVTITIGTPEEAVAVSAGTLTCTITGVDAGGGILDFKANAVSSLTQTTLRCTYQTFKNF